MRSIDSRFAIRKEYRPLPCDPAPWVYRRQSDEYLDAWVSMARFFPIIRLKSCICFSSLNPFKGIIASDYIGYSRVIRIGSYSVPVSPATCRRTATTTFYRTQNVSEWVIICHSERSRGIHLKSSLRAKRSNLQLLILICNFARNNSELSLSDFYLFLNARSLPRFIGATR